MLLKVNPLLWSVQNRPTPTAVRVFVWVAVGVPAFAGALTALAIADIVTRKWPSGVPEWVVERAEVAA